MKDFEDFIIVSATFSQCVGEVLDEILKVINTFRCFFLWNIEGVQLAAILTVFSEGVNSVLVRGCQ